MVTGAGLVPASDLHPAVGFRAAAGRYVRAAMEGVVLLLVVVSPWPYGSVHPGFELLLYAGVALSLLLWGVSVLLAGQLTWSGCAATVCLAGLVLAGLWQLTPLPRATLSWLAPGAAHLYDELLPAEPEMAPGAAEAEPGTTISLYPGGTRRDVVRLLAVFLLFAVVRQGLGSAPALWRLSMVALVNGSLLALFALLQFWTSRPNTVFWAYPSLGTVFGPFINRNHFACYENVCLGLGVGLLLSRRAGLHPGPRGGRNATPGRGEPGVLQDPPTLWIALALALILSSLAVCLSRGGVWSLLGAAVISLVLWGRHKGAGRLTTSLLLTAVPALALIVWFGLDRVTARLETTWTEGDHSRTDAWLRVLPLVLEFPLWGTGYGTFPVVEPMTRTTATDQGYVWEHAHNEYVEAAVEGGLLRLLLGLVVIGLVFRCGYRALRRTGSPASAGLALGALWGFTTIVLHSFVEFGLHVPAIALLAAVLCAQLCALGSPAPGVAEDGPGAARHEQVGLCLWGLAPCLAAGTALLLGLVLVAEGWKAHRAERLLFVARHGQFPSAADRLARLESAVRLAPQDFRPHLELAQGHLLEYQQRGVEFLRRGKAQVGAGAVLALAPSPIPTPEGQAGLTYLPPWLASAFRLEEELRGLGDRHLTPALRQLQQARDACPLLPGPQLELAAHATWLRLGKERLAYLDRARLLAPADPHLHYYCGLKELEWLQTRAAWADWRRSLELSEEHFNEILTVSSKVLAPAEVMERVVPDQPGLLVRAAARLYPPPDGLAAQRPYLEKALRLYEERQGPPRAEDLHGMALTHVALGQPAAALKEYQAALNRQPRRADWRHEYAELLYRQKQLPDARRQLLTVLEQEPGNAPARDLLNTVTADMAKGP